MKSAITRVSPRICGICNTHARLWFSVCLCFAAANVENILISKLQSVIRLLICLYLRNFSDVCSSIFSLNDEQLSTAAASTRLDFVDTRGPCTYVNSLLFISSWLFCDVLYILVLYSGRCLRFSGIFCARRSRLRCLDPLHAKY